MDEVYGTPAGTPYTLSGKYKDIKFDILDDVRHTKRLKHNHQGFVGLLRELLATSCDAGCLHRLC
jgi:hypothetical protein